MMRNGYRCYLCGSTKSTRRYDFKKRYVFRCLDCGYDYNAPCPSDKELKAFASKMYQGGIMPESSDMYANCFKGYKDDPVILEYKRSAALLRELGGGSLLDVGCGTGVFLDIARQGGWSCTGVDLSDYATEYARKEFKLDVMTGDLLEMGFKERSFDVITMWDFIEHVTNPVELIEKSYSLLKPGGLLLAVTPNMNSFLTDVCRAVYLISGGRIISPVEKVYDIFHLSYFNAGTLTGVFKKAGFEIAYMKKSNPFLGRYKLGFFNELALQIIFLVGKLTGRECRIMIIGRKPAL